MQPLSKSLLLKNHPDLSFLMRAKLINWLFEVTSHFKLQRETIYSTQMILDQFLTHCQSPQPRNNFQLIGLAALLISSKLEEVRPPNLNDLSRICDAVYKESEIAKMELEICTCLNWNLTAMSILSWSRIYHVRKEEFTEATNNIISTIEHISDFMIHSPYFLNFKASAIAAALLFHMNPKYPYFEHCTGYSIEGLDEEIKLTKSWIDFLGFKDVTRCLEDVSRLPGYSRIAYCDPSILPPLTEFEIDYILNINIRALNLVLKRIKQEQ